MHQSSNHYLYRKQYQQACAALRFGV